MATTTLPRREVREITIALPEIHIPLPRKDLLITFGILLLGLLLPLLMVIGWVEVNLLTCFLGFTFTAVGGIWWLIRVGEVF